MALEQMVLRSDDARRAELEAAGCAVASRSWAAQLTASRIDVEALSASVRRGRGHGDIREIGDADLESVLALDAATATDYPGGVATRHTPLTIETARVTETRRGFGIFDDSGRAVAVTFVDIDGDRAETDFTVVAAELRGLGLGSAVKAASVLALRDRVAVFRTGGAAENSASLAANLSLGYEVDEEWVTLSAPRRAAETTPRRPRRSRP